MCPRGENGLRLLLLLQASRDQLLAIISAARSGVPPATVL
jgi:hypothetical protein